LKAIRDASRIKGLIEARGDPIEIIGNGHVATLLKKEYAIYLQNKEGYEGVSKKDILVTGAKVTGIPVEKIQRTSQKIQKKFAKWRGTKEEEEGSEIAE
jgi:hypothetical protein